MSERRGSARRKSFLRGCVYFNNRRSAIDCLIRDMSSSGARLFFSGAVSIPDVLEIYIPQKEQTLRGWVEWRHGDEVGISFADRRQREDPAEAELVQRVEKIESEIASLHALLKRLRPQLEADRDEVA